MPNSGPRQNIFCGNLNFFNINLAFYDKKIKDCTLIENLYI